MHVVFRILLVLLIPVVLVDPDAALAYGGPGSVISGIGTLLAVLAALLAALFGFLWFPLKRLYRKIRGREEPIDPAAEGTVEE